MEKSLKCEWVVSNLATQEKLEVGKKREAI